MKYIVFRQIKNGDLFTEEYDTADAAIKDCKDQLFYLTSHDKKITEYLCVLESVNPDEEAEDHLDGNIIYRAI